jgi:hypothetical protein
LTKSCVQSSCLHLESAAKSAKCPTPTPSLHSSDSTFEQVQQISYSRVCFKSLPDIRERQRRKSVRYIPSSWSIFILFHSGPRPR